jgi:hypothetical protein
MTTLERFYFNPDELEISGGCGTNNWHLMFVPASNDGMHIKVSTLDRKTFKALLDRIQEVGAAILAADEAKTESSKKCADIGSATKS